MRRFHVGELVFGLRGPAQGPVQLVTPLVVRAGEEAAAPASSLDQGGASMAANVVVGPQSTALVLHYHQGAGADGGCEVAARCAQLVGRTDERPGAVEQASPFEVEQALGVVPVLGRGTGVRRGGGRRLGGCHWGGCQLGGCQWGRRGHEILTRGSATAWRMSTMVLIAPWPPPDTGSPPPMAGKSAAGMLWSV